MTDEQFEKLIECMSNKPTTSGSPDMMIKLIVSSLLTLCLTGTIWLISTTAQIDKKMGQVDIQIQTIQKDQASYRQDMLTLGNKLDLFSRVPRFSEKDYDQRTTPLSSRTKRNATDIDGLKIRVRNIDERVVKAESRYELILQTMAELKFAVKQLTK